MPSQDDLVVEGQTSHQVWIDEANEIPQEAFENMRFVDAPRGHFESETPPRVTVESYNCERDEHIIRHIPILPGQRIEIPEGFVLMGGQQAGRDARRICGYCGRPKSKHVTGGTGCKEWARMYDGEQALDEFNRAMNDSRNKPRKLEESRQLMRLHLEGEHD